MGANMPTVHHGLVVIILFAFGVIWPSVLDGKEPDSEQAAQSTDQEKRRTTKLLGPGRGEFVFIAGGDFTMGRNIGENDDERPEHLVTLSSFYVGKTPVTNAQFVEFMNDAAVKSDEYLCAQAPWAKSGIARAEGNWICVKDAEADAACGESWMLAERYCAWLSQGQQYT